MKKFIMMAVMTVCALTANAQKGEYYVTPKVDLGYTTVSDMDDIKGGIMGGIGCDFEYMIADQFGLSAGVDFQYMESDKVNNCKFKYSNLGIPVMANVHFGSFAIKAGVQPTFKTSFKLDDGNDVLNASEAAKSFTFYIPVGISYTIKDATVLGLNVNIPCTKMNDSEFIKNKSKLMPIYLSVGYRF